MGTDRLPVPHPEQDFPFAATVLRPPGECPWSCPWCWSLRVGRPGGCLDVGNLIVYVGNSEPQVIEPVIQRLLASADPEVQKVGGHLAAYAGLELGLGHLLTSARSSESAATREGAAELCALRLSHTTNAAAAGGGLHDPGRCGRHPGHDHAVGRGGPAGRPAGARRGRPDPGRVQRP